MDWIDSIREIKKAQENNQLVIFVGAGVSKNSDVPTWFELIEVIAEKIGYDRCDHCSEKDGCPKLECNCKHAFTQDEILRIPEYFYQKDTSENHIDYYRLIQDTLKCDHGSNPINDEIFNILPHHIITTNYDSLLENTVTLNSQLYTVVCQDSDLLSKANERYIIKMHGDINAPKTIVLKESDYIDYEHKHTLISTFIRSLLVNHTFMFLGYSLHDYNLNLILGWINYFREFYRVEDRPLNFLVSPESYLDFEEIRLKEKNISIVDLMALPDDLIEKAAVPKSLSDPVGKKMFSFLRCLTDSNLFQEFIPFAEILSEKYQILKSYQKISFQDLIRVHSLGYTAFIGTELVFYDQQEYDKMVSLIDHHETDVIDTFQRSGLTALTMSGSNSQKKIPQKADTENQVFQLYLDNDYESLLEYVQKSSNISQRIYYFNLLGKNKNEIEELIATEVSSMKRGDYIFILLHKMRAYYATITSINTQESRGKELEKLFDTVPIKYRDAIKNLKLLFEASTKDMFKMEKLVKEQEERYKSKNNACYGGHSFTYIWKLQSYAYDYYFFFKKNFLPLDYFKNAEDYLYYYIKAIICSYSSTKIGKKDTAFVPSIECRHYPFSEIDMDILIKYISPQTLESLLTMYSVQYLEIAEGIDIVKKYKNLCDSFLQFQNRQWINALYNFNIVLCQIQLSEKQKKEVLYTFCMLFEKMAQHNPDIFPDLVVPLDHLLKNMEVHDIDSILGELLDTLLIKEVYQVIRESNRYVLSRMIKQLSPYVKDKTKHLLLSDIDLTKDKTEKINKIVSFRYVLPMELYTDFLNSHIDWMDIEIIFDLIVEGILEYNDKVLQIFVKTIYQEEKKWKENQELYPYPEGLLTAIEDCIILKLIDYDVDLTILEPYQKYSEHLEFLLHPDDFDYTCIDINHYMWQNIIYSPEYTHYFMEHRSQILSNDLENIFSRNLETREQQKIVYGLLLHHKELRSFGT